MRTYSQRFLFNTLIGFFCSLFLFVVVALAGANIYFSRIRGRIEEGLSAYHTPGVSIGRTYYVVPRTLVLKNVVVKGASGGVELARLREASLQFSPLTLFKEKRFELTHVFLNDATIDYSRCSLFLKDHPGYITALLAKLPDLERASVVSKDWRFVFPEGPANQYKVLWNNVFFLEDEFLSVRGSLGLESIETAEDGSKQIMYRVDPLSYQCAGSFTERGFEMEDLNLARRDSYIRLTGVAKNGVLRAQGLASIANFFGREEAEFSPGLKEKIKDFIFSPEKGLPLTGPAAVDLNIVDLNCVVRYTEPDLYIEDISFLSQGVPYALRGTIGLLRPFSWDLVFSSHAGFPAVRREDPKSLDLIIGGVFDQGAISGEVCLDFLRQTKSIQAPDKIKLSFDRVKALPVADERLKVDIGSLKLSYVTPEDEHFLIIDDFNALCELTGEQTKVLTFGARLSDGLIKGKAFVDTTHFPFKNFVSVEISDVSADKLNTLLSNFSKVRGRFSSRIHYRNDPEISFYGNLQIDDGTLDNFEFFVWLSELFRLPSLTSLRFERISSDFLVDSQGASIKDINLVSDDVSIKGFFSVYEEDLVRSKLSLSLSRGLLENSPKFRSLLKLVGEDFTSLDFDFQLSGAVYAMNFQWSESDFKRNLRKRIPDFIERGIERKVEKAIEAIGRR